MRTAHYSTSIQPVLKQYCNISPVQPVWVLSREENSAAKWKLETSVVSSISFMCLCMYLCICVCVWVVLHSVPIWLSPTKQSWIYCRLRQSRAVLSVICKAGEKQLQRSLSKPSSCQSKFQHYFPPTIKHYFPPTIKGLHHFARPGQVGKQAEVEEARKQAMHSLLSYFLFPIKKHSFALYQMHWRQIRRWIRGDQSECRDLIKHHRESDALSNPDSGGRPPHWLPCQLHN